MRYGQRGANKSQVALEYKYGSMEAGKTELSSIGSLKMSLLTFALLSTALAVPPPCPPMAPINCGEGRMKCPGPINPQGCKMPDSCVALGDKCPVHCPHRPPIDCGPGRTKCPGPIDPQGCKMPESCVALGDKCPVHCPHRPPIDCGPGRMKCPGPIDPQGCKMPDTCMPHGEACPVPV